LRARLSVTSRLMMTRGLTYRKRYTLVRAGLLPATTDSAGRRVAQWVDIHALNEFREQYILGTELAALARTSPKQVAQRLKACGIQPIAGPGSARTSCRQYVWQRTPGVLSATVAEM
jgi:hypothetical protein